MAELGITLVIAFAWMTVGWVVSLLRRDASVVDIGWGLGFVLVAWAIYMRLADGELWARVLLAMVSLWGVRLSIHIARRNLGKGEDYRYRAMREKRPDTFARDSLFTVFYLQAVLMAIVSLPLQWGISRPPSTGALPILGLFVYALGVFFEAVGDWQLARFKADPANKDRVMDRGLWRYTRHPNYFGDFCVWWGIYLIALAAGHWWTIGGPVVMTALLMKYSGAGLLEKTIGKRRPGYAEYIRRTNGFFPGPPRKPVGSVEANQ
jgi:steroid 5-alpha reductase family enzyme